METVFQSPIALNIDLQVHATFRKCLDMRTGSCPCAVYFREHNTVIGIDACGLDRPPRTVMALASSSRPADNIDISADGLTYIVSSTRTSIQLSRKS